MAKLLVLLDAEDRGTTTFRSVETKHTKTKSQPTKFQSELQSCQSDDLLSKVYIYIHTQYDKADVVDVSYILALTLGSHDKKFRFLIPCRRM